MATGRKEELLRAIRTADEQIQLLAQARADAVAELERIMQQEQVSDYSDGVYRARFVRRLKVVSEEQLAELAPDLVEVQQVTRLKVDMSRLRALWDTPLRQGLGLDRVVNEVTLLDVGEETRKTVREVVK